MLSWRFSATIGRAELTAFLCLLRKAVGPTKVHVDIKRYHVERRTEMKTEHFVARTIFCLVVSRTLEDI